MARPELIRELKIREQELAEELEAIRKILASNSIISTVEIEKPSVSLQHGKVSISDIQKTQENGSYESDINYPPKGDTSWEEYTKIMLSKIGGRGRTGDVYNAAIKANPNIDTKTVKMAIKGKLSILYRKGEIDAVEGKIKSEGHEYFVKEY